MQLVSEFLEKFKNCLLQQDIDQLMSLNMSDDITGWGINDEDDFNSTEDLFNRFNDRNRAIESRSIELDPLDVFGNGDAMALICNCRLETLLKNGQRKSEDNLRFSFYLINDQDQLKIRHAHLSRPMPKEGPFPARRVAIRPDQRPSNSVRLDHMASSPFLQLLDKRSEYTAKGDLEALLGLQHPNNSNVFWQLVGTSRGAEQYYQHMQYLKEHFQSPAIKYLQPVIFRNRSLACMSVYAEASHIENNARHNIFMLRATYILQETEGQWLTRHSHWSLPFPDQNEG